jgi:hypothetical protein
VPHDTRPTTWFDRFDFRSTKTLVGLIAGTDAVLTHVFFDMFRNGVQNSS